MSEETNANDSTYITRRDHWVVWVINYDVKLPPPPLKHQTGNIFSNVYLSIKVPESLERMCSVTNNTAAVEAISYACDAMWKSKDETLSEMQ